MNIKDVLSISKDLLYVSPKDSIGRKYLGTKKKNHQYIISCIEKKEFDENQLIDDEPIIQEFTFTENLFFKQENITVKIYTFTFSNISIGSFHNRDLHDFDLQVVRKLSMLELLGRTKMAKGLCRDFKSVEKKLDFKQLDYSVILKKDQEISGSHVKIPFIFAIAIDNIKQSALDTKEIFRKSIRLVSQMEFFKDLHKWLSSDNNNILNIYNALKTAEPILLCSTFKMLIQTFNPLLPINIMKFLCTIPIVEDPKLTVFLYQCLISQIPDTEKNVLETILDLLALVIQNKNKNNICLEGIARLFAPVLLNPTSDFVDSSIDVLIQMVHYRKLIFLIPHNAINQYRNINGNDQSEFQNKKNIGKKSSIDSNEKSVELMVFKHKRYWDKKPEESITELSIQDNFKFKYRKSKLEITPTNSTITQDVLNEVIKRKDIDKNIELRLYENSGNIYQLCLHPNMRLFKAINDNYSAEFVVQSAPEYDLVYSTMKALNHYLNFDEQS